MDVSTSECRVEKLYLENYETIYSILSFSSPIPQQFAVSGISTYLTWSEYNLEYQTSHVKLKQLFQVVLYNMDKHFQIMVRLDLNSNISRQRPLISEGFLFYEVFPLLFQQFDKRDNSSRIYLYNPISYETEVIEFFSNYNSYYPRVINLIKQTTIYLDNPDLNSIVAFIATTSEVEFNSYLRGTQIKSTLLPLDDFYITMVTFPRRHFHKTQPKYWNTGEYNQVCLEYIYQLYDFILSNGHLFVILSNESKDKFIIRYSYIDNLQLFTTINETISTTPLLVHSYITLVSEHC